MFDFVRNNPKVTQIFLGVMTLAMASWGIDYFRGGSSKEVAAQVGDSPIYQQQFKTAFQQWMDQMQQSSGGAVDTSLLDSPDSRARILNQLIDQEALRVAATKAHLSIPDSAVRNRILSNPSFQENGVFSKQLYNQLLNSAGVSAQSYEAQTRESLALSALLTPIADSAAAARISAQRWIALSGEERSISELDVDGKTYLDQVKLPADAAKKYYEANLAKYHVAEQAKIEYVVLDLDDVAKSIKITDAQARDWYQANMEERSARHILVQVSKNATAEQKAAAHKKAEELLAEVRKDPSKFAEIAKASSDDKVSAAQGGQLDFFTQKDMDPDFAKAAFALKQGEISDVVQSSFGYHIIMLTGIRSAKTFEQVKDEAYAGARKEVAEKEFLQLANDFSNLVWEQRDSLKPAADKFGLKLVQTDWISRDALPAALRNAKVQQALFAEDARTDHRNIEAVDEGDNTMVSARILDYKPATTKPFEQVSAQAEAGARAEAANKLARTQGEELLAKLQDGKVPPDLKWKASRSVQRSGTDLDGGARKKIFSAKTDKLPSYVGVTADSGYAIYRIDGVTPAKDINDDKRIKDIQERYASMLSSEDQRAFVEGLRNRFGVKIMAAQK